MPLAVMSCVGVAVVAVTMSSPALPMVNVCPPKMTAVELGWIISVKVKPAVAMMRVDGGVVVCGGGIVVVLGVLMPLGPMMNVSPLTTMVVGVRPGPRVNVWVPIRTVEPISERVMAPAVMILVEGLF
jgi:hypothetical protein